MRRYQQIVSNFSGPMRRERRDGREYLVCPTTILVPGVLSGNHGPLLYPPETVQRDASAWNGQPVVVEHPVRNGRSISASHPSVRRFGMLDRARIANGKLVADAWLDVETFRRERPDLLRRIETGDRLEVSTGLFDERDEAPPGASHNGQPYTAVVRRIRPDHLALLPSTRGACSIKDGCGLNVNRHTAREIINLLNSHATRHEGRNRKMMTNMGEPMGVPEIDWEAYSDLRPAAPPISWDAPEGGLGLPAIDWQAVSPTPPADDWATDRLPAA